MQTEEPVKDHRQFLKKVSLECKLGMFFPKELVLLPKTEPTAFDWLHKTEHGSVLFFLSHTCAACKVEPVQEFVKQYPDFTYCVFFEGNQETMDLQREVYELDIPFYACDIAKLQPQTQVNAVPYALILNPVGQVVGGNIFNDFLKLNSLAAPLIQVYEMNRMRV